jgi:hypothetical protein
MNAATGDEASEIDYLMSNVELSTATGEWVVKTYSQRNWVEVFYREALVMVRAKRISSQR